MQPAHGKPGPNVHRNGQGREDSIQGPDGQERANND
jgi:hypothetical protein